jgi:hypothetical protein
MGESTMSPWLRHAFVAATLCTLSTTALAQVPPPDAPPPDSSGMPAPMPAPTMTPPPGEEPPPPEEKKKEPKRGDFDAGGQARFPNGPDENNEYATFNWVAVDVKGRYFLLDSVSINGFIPMALIHPDHLPMELGGAEPSMWGGFALTLDAKLPKSPIFKDMTKDTEVGVLLTGAYMREGAMLLSEKDFPLFTGSFHPGFSGGIRTRVKLGSVIDFNLNPAWVIQGGEMESLTAVQIPMSLVLGIGDVAKLSAELGIFTGDDYSFKGENGGRVATGAALDVKIGPMLMHAGAGVATLTTGPMYPTVKESFYVDVNAKYVK